MGSAHNLVWQYAGAGGTGVPVVLSTEWPQVTRWGRREEFYEIIVAVLHVHRSRGRFVARPTVLNVFLRCLTSNWGQMPVGISHRLVHTEHFRVQRLLLQVRKNDDHGFTPPLHLAGLLLVIDSPIYVFLSTILRQIVQTLSTPVLLVGVARVSNTPTVPHVGAVCITRFTIHYS